MDDNKLVVPVGGFGLRFVNSGEESPKPFIEVQGRSQIEWSILSAVKSFHPLQVLVGVRSGLLPQAIQHLCNVEVEAKTEILIFDIGETTRGAADTVHLTLERAHRFIGEHSIVIVDSDVFSLTQTPETIFQEDVESFVIGTPSVHPQHSFLEVSNGRVTRIEEKNMISTMGAAGQCGFKSAEFFIKCYEQTKFHSKVGHNEEYLSTILNTALNYGESAFLQSSITKSLGTPAEIELLNTQLENYLRN
jgi:choline kinase